MRRDELIKKLHFMYFNANEKEKVAMIHLFGIKYVDDIREHGTLKSLVKDAGLSVHYATEVSKGMKLSNFVDIKSNIKI